MTNGADPDIITKDGETAKDLVDNKDFLTLSLLTADNVEDIQMDEGTLKDVCQLGSGKKAFRRQAQEEKGQHG